MRATLANATEVRLKPKRPAKIEKRKKISAHLSICVPHVIPQSYPNCLENYNWLQSARTEAVRKQIREHLERFTRLSSRQTAPFPTA